MNGDATSRLREKKARVDRLRPLNPKSLEVLAAWYEVELTSTSDRY